MTEIVRGDGMKYVLAYNAFHNLESIGVDGKSEQLVRYTYKNGNGRLKEITYANGDTMKATYNSVGQMVAEKWYNASNELTAHYKYVYDGQGNIVRSLDISGSKEYNYVYEEGRITRSTEADIVLSGEFVTAKTIVNSIRYYYDGEGKLKRKTVTSADGTARSVFYETKDDNTVVYFAAGSRNITSHSKNDSFGRKAFDELQLATGFVSRRFLYAAGEVTEEHVENVMLKSSPTTQLVSQIVLTPDRTISYEYDAEERITRVIDSVDGTTEYTYDALGQLLTETRNGTVVNTMTYDNYGNLLTKNGVEYTYGDTAWKDLLTGYGNQAITYDAQGNPTSYLGHTLTWEKGRQLKSFDNIQYTYNANGIRTSKTVDGVKHTYILDGTRILREEWGANTLIPLYDNENSVCGILYNEKPFYFQKNLQGDVIALVNKDAEVVAQYAYDAWGVCTVTQDDSDCQIATVNPYRYRSYYYDNEIGLYYLQSRYYDAVVGRFINADKCDNIGITRTVCSHCVFAYCDNDSINDTDCSGFFSWAIFGDMIQRIVSFAKDLLSFVLEKYGLSRKAYEKRTKYKEPSALLSYVNGHKSSIKNVQNNASSISSFMNIVLTVADCASILRSNRSVLVKIADLLFYGVIRLLGYLGGKLISWLVSKVFAALWWCRFIIERLLNILWDWVLNSKWVDKLKNKFLQYVDSYSMTFSGYVVALFKGAKDCFA